MTTAAAALAASRRPRRAAGSSATVTRPPRPAGSRWTAGPACRPAGPPDLSAVFELRATDGERELRWLHDDAGLGRSAILTGLPQPVAPAAAAAWPGP